jgi:anaphase-promoting complex subunit 2
MCSLTDEEAGGDLYEELHRQDARPLEQAHLDSDDETDPPELNWVPPPPLSKQRHSFLGTGSKGGDILSMLVSIYGSKELFANEY